MGIGRWIRVELGVKHGLVVLVTTIFTCVASLTLRRLFELI
jgi:hypothetical protein